MGNTLDARLALIRDIMYPHVEQRLESTKWYMRSNPEKYPAFHGTIEALASCRQAKSEQNLGAR